MSLRTYWPAAARPKVIILLASMVGFGVLGIVVHVR